MPFVIEHLHFGTCFVGPLILRCILMHIEHDAAVAILSDLPFQFQVKVLKFFIRHEITTACYPAAVIAGGSVEVHSTFGCIDLPGTAGGLSTVFMPAFQRLTVKEQLPASVFSWSVNVLYT